jgi:hypothetical protein
MSSIPTAYCQDEGQRILVVEGKDDCHGIYQFADRCGLTGRFGIWAANSDGKALARFGGLFAANDRPDALGLVIDCDPSGAEDGLGLMRRWQQIESRVKEFGYTLPKKPVQSGTIIESPLPGSLPRIGVWIMPDNEMDGMFEDFLISLVAPATSQYVRTVVQKARADGHADYNPLHESKAVAHTILAWKDEPGRPLGLGMKMGAFDTNNPLAQAFKDWLADLFPLNQSDSSNLPVAGS